MPAKNSLKQYLENGFYHLYNRGVEKRNIFQDEQDYGVFLSYLKEYLMPKNEKELYLQLSDPNISSKERARLLKLLRMNNFYGEIDLLSYSLMPNHFHFMIHQRSLESIDRFMNSIGTRYTMYFNEKNKRVGSLCQGVYKAVLIESDEQLLHLSKYIHRQALFFKPASKGEALRSWKEKQPSSFPDYLNLRKTSWIRTDEILSFYSKSKKNSSQSYEAFVIEGEQSEIINKLLID